jgi:NAD(P)-dependent dehydrogenase (short-subunit alcohol dehydrogenase family)
MAKLKDAVVILTGAAGGIGRATTQALVDRGARVLAVDRDEAGLAELGDGVSKHVADLRDMDAIDALVAELHAVHGQIDVLINNAALTVHGKLNAMDADEVDRVLDVDLRAPLHLTRALLPKLRSGSHVVFISSMSGLQAFPTQSTYTAAKFGLRGFGAALRVELAREGIGVSTVFPGTIATSFLASAKTQDAATTTKLAELMMRFGTPPPRVAQAIVTGIEKNRGTLRVGWDCWALSVTSWMFPPLVPFVLRQVHRRKLLGDM